jgi:hypothetical protein
MVVQAIELMSADLRQAEPLAAGSQQSLQDVPGKGGNIVGDLVVESQDLFVEQRCVGILNEGEHTSKGRVPQIMA